MLEEDSPCIGYCSTTLGDKVCRGCGRTSAEVDNWILLDDAKRRVILTRIEKMDTIRNARARALLEDEKGSSFSVA